jgi:hypothetical protein
MRGGVVTPFDHNGGPPLEDERASNWFAVSRDIFDHSIVGIRNRPYTELEAWLSLLAMAQYEPTQRVNKGQIVVLDPGQLMAAHSYLADRWKWTSSKVRRFLDLLMMDAMITRFTNEKKSASERQANRPEIGTQTGKQNDKRGGNQIQIITICNYARYQLLQEADRQANRQALQQASDKQTASECTENRQQFNKEQITQEIESLSSPAPEARAAAKKNYGEVLEAFNAYNETALRCRLPQSSRLTPALRSKISARLKDHGVDGWKRALANLERSAFLCGDNDSGFRASLAWICKPEKYENLHAGTYGNGRHRNQAQAYFDPEARAAVLDEWERARQVTEVFDD